MFFNTLRIKAQSYISVIRLAPFDMSTPAGRSKERYRRIALTTIAATLLRGITILTTLVSVPLTINYLGAERFGLWMTIISMIALVGLADLGVGNGLVNAITEAEGRGDSLAARRYVSSGFFVLLAIGLFILLLFGILYPFIQWPRLFNVKSDLAILESGPSVAILFACYALAIPLGVVQRVQMGYQEGFVNYLWQSAGSILALGGVILAIHFQAGLPWLVLAMAGAPLFLTLVNWFIQFRFVRPWLWPHWSQFQISVSRSIVGTGMLFFILQLLTLIGNATDNLIIAQVLGASAVAGYSVVMRLFSAALVTQMFLIPLWPAFGEALARLDYSWAQRALTRSLVLSVGLGCATALPLLLFGKQIIALWAGPDLVPTSEWLLVGFFFWVPFSAYGNTMSSFLNNGSGMRRQVAFFAAASFAALLLKIILIGYWSTAGVIWATVLGYGLLYVVPAARLARSILLTDRV